MISRIAVYGYRSLRDLCVPLGPLTLVTGANGSGKSSLYRALRLLADVAQGRVVQSLAAEGGLGSTLWAGPAELTRAMKLGEVPVQGTRRRTPVALKLGFGGDGYGYAIDLGFPVPIGSAFDRDPAIKAEALWTGDLLGRTNVVAERTGPYVRVRGSDGGWIDAATSLSPFDSMMTHASDPREAPEPLIVREQLRGWRFYDHFRTDRDAPVRRAPVGTHTPVLAADGADLGAAFQTIREIGDASALGMAVEDAFPGSALADDSFTVAMRQRGLLRALQVDELSDGTVRYLLLIAALLSPRPPALMILNEPETSLHGDLLPALARLIGAAAANSQIVVISHAPPLVDALGSLPGCLSITLRKELGETHALDVVAPKWSWPVRPR